MNIRTNFPLKSYNTFGIDATAKKFIKINSLGEAVEFFKKNTPEATEPILILGGGSNVLFTNNFEGTILHNNIKGIKKLDEDEKHVYIEAMAGEVWHEFVQYCLENNLAGVENLSLIPGNVGASPMQNIGAYGVEVKDVIEKVKAIEMETSELVEFSAAECKFDYRSSIFKTSHKNKYFISSVIFRLNKKPNFQISYGAIVNELEKLEGELSIQKISQAVINIRQSKLPDPKKIGNAGSFFKNPIVDKADYNDLLEAHPGIPVYPVSDTQIKFAAGWLIEQCGWKGKDLGGYGVHKDQSLVLVNYGGATGDQIYQLSEDIIQSVQNKFGILLEREVNVVDSR